MSIIAHALPPADADVAVTDTVDLTEQLAGLATDPTTVDVVAGELRAGQRLYTGHRFEEITAAPTVVDGVVHVPTSRDGQARTRTFSPDEQVRIDPLTVQARAVLPMDTRRALEALAANPELDAAWMVHAALRAGMTEVEIMELLDIDKQEFAHLYLDHVYRERGALHMVGTRPRRNEGRPAWLTEKCPSWCDSDHQEEDHPDDRSHMRSEQFAVDLSRHPKVKDQVLGLDAHGDPMYSYAPQQATISLYRKVGNPDAEIEVTRGVAGVLLSLTTGEARELAAQLVLMADVAEDGDR